MWWMLGRGWCVSNVCCLGGFDKTALGSWLKFIFPFQKVKITRKFTEPTTHPTTNHTSKDFPSFQQFIPDLSPKESSKVISEVKHRFFKVLLCFSPSIHAIIFANLAFLLLLIVLASKHDKNFPTKCNGRTFAKYQRLKGNFCLFGEGFLFLEGTWLASCD